MLLSDGSLSECNNIYQNINSPFRRVKINFTYTSDLHFDVHLFVNYIRTILPYLCQNTQNNTFQVLVQLILAWTDQNV